MTPLVTGAMGHVGYEVVCQAVKKEMTVVALYRGGIHKPETLDAGSNVRWLQCDLNDPSAVANLAQYPIDACIHAAAISMKPMRGQIP